MYKYTHNNSNINRQEVALVVATR